MIIGNVVGGSPLVKSYILETEDGKEIPAVLTAQEVVFDATPNDIREGKVAATGDGVTVGEKVIPSYHTTAMERYIPDGSKFIIPLPNMNKYDYTSLQVIICKFNSTVNESILSEKVVIFDKVYNVGSDKELSTVMKDNITKSIDLGITNNSGYPCVVRFFTYKEID